MNSQSHNRPTPSRERALFSDAVYRNDEEKPQELRSEVLDEIAALRAEVRTEVRALRGAMRRPRPENAMATELAALRAAVDQLLFTPKKGDAYAAMIRNVGIEGAAAAALTRAGKKTATTNEERFAEALTSLIAVAPWPVALPEPKLVALVGPAGVGKTTTAAKLGAKMIRKKKTVAFVSCDAYRVGALDQLRRYADLMEAPFYAVATGDELLTVVREITADVIIVDTSGRPVEEGSVEAMLGDERIRDEALFDRKVEVMLCTPAALRGADANRVARDFAMVAPTSVCITKLDETDAPSALAHAPFATNLPISTICFGQRVPEDIGPATHEEIVKRLVPAAQPEAATEEQK